MGKIIFYLQFILPIPLRDMQWVQMEPFLKQQMGAQTGLPYQVERHKV